jgi:arginyl-tRNA synthetase
MSLRAALRRAISDAIERAAASGDLTLSAPVPMFSVERPAKAEHGDWATNAAMQLAPLARMAPMRIADAIIADLRPPDGIAGTSVAAPGFINFVIDPQWLSDQVGAILAAGQAFGRTDAPRRERINVEFVSANPTGPLTVGNARGAFVGDLLSRVLEGAGREVTREYYFNDSGAQVRNLGLSVLAIRDGTSVPEDGYHGEYVADLATELPESVLAEAQADGERAGWVVGRWASERVREGIERSLANLGVAFDVWTIEGEIHRAGWVERGIAQLRERGYLCEEGGATWFRATAFGDDKDRVVIRSNGQPTYFASDLGYIAQKFSRGFGELIYLWGEDHHGTVTRNRAAAQALGFDAEAVHWMLMAWVRFVRDGVDIGMSKRSGEFISLDELLAEIGPDAARWYFGSRATTTGIDLDIELAKKQSAENPVYYVQYAHARCSSILRRAAHEKLAPDARDAAQLLVHPAEQALVRRLLAMPDVVADAAERRETHELTHYCLEVAQLFSAFYRDCRVLPDEPAEIPLSQARLALTGAARQVLANALGLLGISAPESM